MCSLRCSRVSGFRVAGFQWSNGFYRVQGLGFWGLRFCKMRVSKYFGSVLGLRLKDRSWVFWEIDIRSIPSTVIAP